MIGQSWIDTVSRLLTTSPVWSVIFVAALQIIGIAGGILALRRFHRYDKSWVYLFCLGGVVAAIMVLPLRLARWEWSCPVSFIEQKPAIAVAKPIVASLDSVTQSASNQIRLDFTIPKKLLDSSPANSLEADSTVASSDTAAPSTATHADFSRSVLQVAITIYAIVVLLKLLAIARGWQLLRRAAKRGCQLDEASSRLVEECRQKLMISSRVLVLRSSEVSTPLTFGLKRSVVLLPVDFEEWSILEKRAVAMHEFLHIARRDMIGELLVRVMQALYWLHPASHWIAKQVRVAREGATDQRVIAAGFSPQEYARCLVQILERERSRNTKGRTCVPSIAMSAYGDMEVRINSILSGEEKMDFVRKSICIVCLVLFMAFTMVRLEAVPCQAPLLSLSESDQVSTVETNSTDSSQSELASNQDQSSAVLTDRSTGMQRNDFLDLIMNTPVANNIRTPDGLELHLAGRVLAPNGEPAQGCTVVLTHMDQGQLAKMAGSSFDGTEKNLDDIRIQNLLARTITDEEGRYTLKNVFAASDLKLDIGPREWTGHLIAAESKLGIGWTEFISARERRIDRELNIHLNAMNSAQGQCLNSDGSPASETNVAISSLIKIAEPRRAGLFMFGALQLNTRTDSDGRFQFLHLPENIFASISASGSNGLSNTLLRLTTKQGENKSDLETTASLLGTQVQTSPVQLNLRKPLQIPVRVVNAKGEPISGARLRGPGLNQETDHQGMTSWTINAQIETRLSGAQGFELNATFAEDSPYLRTTTKVQWDSSTVSKPFEIIVEKGTRVRGKVVTKEGTNATGVLICDLSNLGQSATVKEDGNFTITLAKKKCRLIVCRSAGGYRIPSTEQVLSLRGSTLEYPTDWKIIEVDATKVEDIELPTITIQKSEPINVIARLPNGLPARNATVILTDINIVREQRNTNIRKQFLSMNTSTDADGLATILADGLPSKLASVEVRLLQENAPYLGIASLDQVSHGKLLVQLIPEWIIRGRISLDGKPVQGAWMHAIRHVSPNGETLRPDSVMHCTMETNHLGEYEFIMPRDRDYEIQVSSLPQDNSCYGSTHKLIRRSANEMDVPEFRYERGTESIQGSVADLKGKPVAGAMVSLRGPYDRLWIGQSRSSTVRTDPSGRFLMANLPSGPWRLSATWIEGPQKSASSNEVSTSTGDTNVLFIVPTIQGVDDHQDPKHK